MKFNYQSRTEDGEIKKGTVEASSKEAALDLLQKHGFYVSYLELAEEKPFYSKEISLFQKITKKDIVNLSRQLALMFRANISLVEALNTVADQMDNPLLREKLVKISDSVEGGRSLSDSMADFSDTFSPFYIWMIKAGEESGKLSESLNYLARHQEREYKFMNKIKGALTYPILILVVVLLVLLLVIFFIIPQLTSVLEGIDQELPITTKIVMALPVFFKKWGWALLVILGISGVLGYKYYKTDEGKKKFDTYLLSVPVIGEFMKKMYLSRFADNFTTLASAGLPLTKSLEIVSNIVGNEKYREIIKKAKDGVTRGRNVSSILENYPRYFPPMFTQMIVIGEKTGTLNSSLNQVSDFYQDEVNRGVEQLISLLEPIMIIFLGLVVGGILMSVLMPMYSMLSI